MHKFIIAALLTICLFTSCTSDKGTANNYSKFLNKDSVPSQFITIDNNKDTSFHTANGAIIKIQKGSFSKNQVRLQIKEAYSIEQMVIAGLTTESYGKTLSSGGMIYINSVDKNIEINKPLNISIPANYYDGRMQLYNGEEKNGKINWIDPQPLPASDTLPPFLAKGKLLFVQSCSPCHGLYQAITGPALSRTEERGPWRDRSRLIEFTENPAAFMVKSCYARNLLSMYKQMMPPFPQMSYDLIPKTEEPRIIDTIPSDKYIHYDTAKKPGIDLNAIYDYIRNEDYKNGISYSYSFKTPCEDSCWRYDSLMMSLQDVKLERQALISDNGQRINFDRQMDPVIVEPSGDPVITFTSVDIVPLELPVPEKVIPDDYQSIYYQFEINTFGWFNIDRLIDPSAFQAELKVEMEGAYQDNMSVFIVVPDQKVFDEGGPLQGEKNIFGFYERDGKIPLNPGTKVIVFAVGEAEGKIVFDFKQFSSAEKQTIILHPRISSKSEFNRTVRRFRIDNVNITSQESKNAEAIRKTDKQIQNKEKLLEKYTPKNCDCNCGAATATSDTSSTNL